MVQFTELCVHAVGQIHRLQLFEGALPLLLPQGTQNPLHSIHHLEYIRYTAIPSFKSPSSLLGRHTSSLLGRHCLEHFEDVDVESSGEVFKYIIEAGGVDLLHHLRFLIELRGHFADVLVAEAEVVPAQDADDQQDGELAVDPLDAYLGTEGEDGGHLLGFFHILERVAHVEVQFGSVVAGWASGDDVARGNCGEVVEEGEFVAGELTDPDEEGAFFYFLVDVAQQGLELLHLVGEVVEDQFCISLQYLFVCTLLQVDHVVKEPRVVVGIHVADDIPALLHHLGSYLRARDDVAENPP